MYPDEAKIKALIEEVAKYGYCKIDDTTSVFEAQVIENMVEDKQKMGFIVSRMVNKLTDMAEELNDELYEEHARTLVVYALSSVEGEANASDE